MVLGFSLEFSGERSLYVGDWKCVKTGGAWQVPHYFSKVTVS